MAFINRGFQVEVHPQNISVNIKKSNATTETSTPHPCREPGVYRPGKLPERAGATWLGRDDEAKGWHLGSKSSTPKHEPFGVCRWSALVARGMQGDGQL